MVTPCALLPPALQLGASEERVQTSRRRRRYRQGARRKCASHEFEIACKVCATTKGNLTNL